MNLLTACIKFLFQFQAFSVSDEYTDPYDAVHEKPSFVKSSNSTADGYIEPFEAQMMYHGM